MKIITNNIPRNTLNAWDLTAQELAEFDYYTKEELQGLTFVRYKSQCYCLAEFMRAESGGELAGAGWHGYEPATVWSGVLVRIIDDGERVIVGAYYA